MSRKKTDHKKKKEVTEEPKKYEKTTRADGEPYKYNYTTKPGRPSNYRPEYCELALDMMSKGASITAVAAELKVPRAKLWEWSEVNPEFRSALEAGKGLAQAWWEKLASGVASGQASSHPLHKKANPALIMFMMSRRFQDYYPKSQADIRQEMNVKQTKEVLVFESQLADGVIRQKTETLGEAGVIDGIIDEITGEICQKPEFE